MHEIQMVNNMKISFLFYLLTLENLSYIKKSKDIQKFSVQVSFRFKLFEVSSIILSSLKFQTYLDLQVSPSHAFEMPLCYKFQFYGFP